MLHARWAMLGVVGLVVPDVLGAPLYLLPDLASLPLLTFTIQAVVALGALEIFRGARRLEARLGPGGRVLGLRVGGFTIQAVVALGALEIHRGARRLEARPH